MQLHPYWDSWGTLGRAVRLPIPPTRRPQLLRDLGGSEARSEGHSLRWAEGGAQVLPGVEVRTRGGLRAPRGMHLQPSRQPWEPPHPGMLSRWDCTDPPGRGREGPGSGRPGPGRQREGAQPHQESRYNREGDSEAARHPGWPCCQP